MNAIIAKKDILMLKLWKYAVTLLLHFQKHLRFSFDSLKLVIVVQEYYFRLDECYRPRILGMTASPIIQKGERGYFAFLIGRECKS
jgi:hypothetical protein